MTSFLTSFLSCCSESPTSTRFLHHPDLEATPEPNTQISSRSVPTKRRRRRTNNTPRRPTCHSFARTEMVQEGPSLMPPPRYEDLGYCPIVVRVTDEKDTDIYTTAEEVCDSGAREPRPWRQWREEENDPNPRLSVALSNDGSSVISVPSTMLSGLTSDYTGGTVASETVRYNDGSHVSCSGPERRGEDVSAPPSYYAGMDDDDEQQRHPVLDEGWLERLRIDAERNARTASG